MPKRRKGAPMMQRIEFHNRLFRAQREGEFSFPCPADAAHGEMVPVGRDGRSEFHCGECSHTEPIGDREDWLRRHPAAATA